MNKPTMTGGNPCEAHLNIKTGGYCPICMGEELDSLKELNREMVEALKDIAGTISMSRKGSMGGVGNVYLPQIGVEEVNRLRDVLAKAEGEG